MEMIFERRDDGTPAARMPTRGDGTPRTPDGVRFFSLRQAQTVFGMSEGALKVLYDDTFGDLFPTGATPAEESGLTLPIESKRMIAVRRDLLAAFRFPHLAESELDAVVDMCANRRLDPWRHVYAEVYHSQQGRRELRVMTTIDGLRMLADRTGRYDGTTLPQYLDSDGVWHEAVWPAHLGQPVAAKIGVRRKGFSHIQEEVARWDRYVPFVQTARGMEVSEAWIKGGPEQLAKCALALSYRSTFPEETGGLYVREEMAQAANPAPRVPAPAGVVRPGPAAMAFGGDLLGAGSDGVEEIEFSDQTPDTVAEFHHALAERGFTSEQSRAAVISRLRVGLSYSPTSRTFFAAAIQRLRARPDLYGASVAAMA